MAQTSFIDRVRQTLNFGEIFPADPRRTVRYLPLPTQAAGITLTYDAALQLSVVWACMDAVTKAIASSHWKVFSHDKSKRVALPDDPVQYMLSSRPNPEMTSISARESLLYQGMSWGNAYAEIVRDTRGQVKELWPLFSDRMIPRRIYNDDGTSGPLVYDYYQFTGGWVTLPADRIFHLRGPSINGLLGENMIARAAKSIALAIAAERFASSFFANGTIVGTVLKYPRTLSPDAHKRLKEDWMDQHAGPDKANRPVILEGGMEIQSIAAKPDEMNLVAERTFQVEEICRWFGVPPHKVQHLNRATFNNIEHLGLEFVRDALTPWALRLEQEADFKLFPQRAPWRYTKLDTEWLSHGDALSRAQSHKIYREIGVYSANDILEREGRNQIGPEGDIRIVPLNFTPLTGMEIQLEKMQADVEQVQAQTGHTDAKTERVKSAGSSASSETGSEVDNGAGGSGGGDSVAAPETLKNAAEGSKIMAETALYDAVHTLIAGSLQRYGRRIENRRANLMASGKKTPLEIISALAEERAKLRPTLINELEDGIRLLRIACIRELSEADYLLAADEIDNGVAAIVMASQLMDRATKP